MNNFFNNESNEITNQLIKGVGTEKFYLYLQDNNIYIKISDIRCFRVSLRRLRNIFHIKNDDEVKKIFLKYYPNISVEKQNENSYYLNIHFPQKINITFNLNHKIKIKEINNFLYIHKTDKLETIILKQNEKLLSLLEKLNQYENKYKELTTDEEMFLIY
jgi:hypothetical protein